MHAVLGIAQIATGKFFDFLQPVAQRVAVDMQSVGHDRQVFRIFKKRSERRQQFAAVPLVIFVERPQHFRTETFQLLAIGYVEQHFVKTQ